MKELVIISGKGGTGKTSITASLAALANRVCIADCDVDAPDLQIIFDPEVKEERDFFGSEKAEIDLNICTSCGACRDACRFGAISEKFVVDHFKCEGCGTCKIVCPVDAITMKKEPAGKVWYSNTRVGPFSHALLFPGEENSGKLVTEVREAAREKCTEKGFDLIISDGPPGIGCPVIAAITGSDLAAVVVEPSISGIHGMSRVVELCAHFRVRVVLVINKSGLSESCERDIEKFCDEKGIVIAGRIPFDPVVTMAMRERKAVTELFPHSNVSRACREAWNKLYKMLFKEGGN